MLVERSHRPCIDHGARKLRAQRLYGRRGAQSIGEVFASAQREQGVGAQAAFVSDGGEQLPKGAMFPSRGLMARHDLRVGVLEPIDALLTRGDRLLQLLLSLSALLFSSFGVGRFLLAFRNRGFRALQCDQLLGQLIELSLRRVGCLHLFEGFGRAVRGRGLTVDHDDDLRISITAPVHSAEALDHPLPRDEVTDHVVRVHVHTNLTSTRRNQKGQTLWRGACTVFLLHEAMVDEPRGHHRALKHAARAHEELDGRPRRARRCGEAAQGVSNVDGVLARVAEHETPNFVALRRHFPCLFGENVGELWAFAFLGSLVGVVGTLAVVRGGAGLRNVGEIYDAQRLLRSQALPDVRVATIIVG